VVIAVAWPELIVGLVVGGVGVVGAVTVAGIRDQWRR
jgi:hypothetical protein